MSQSPLPRYAPRARSEDGAARRPPCTSIVGQQKKATPGAWSLSPLSLARGAECLWVASDLLVLHASAAAAHVPALLAPSGCAMKAAIVHLPPLASPRETLPAKPRREKARAPPLQPMAAMSFSFDLHKCMLKDPILRVSDIEKRVFDRNGGTSGSLSVRSRTQVVELPTPADVSSYLSARQRQGDLPAGYLMPASIPIALDAEQKRSLLWGEFQLGITNRRNAATNAIDRHEPQPPSTRVPRSSRPRGSRRKVEEEAPTDWPSRVALKLHQTIQHSHEKVRDTFSRFDTDGSGGLDAQEFDAALRELKIFDSMSIPVAEQSLVLFEVFDAFDADGNGILDYHEVQKQLRPGKHGVRLPKKLQPGAAPVQLEVQQTHAVRKKEEWKALERFDTLLDGNGDGVVASQEALSLLLAEGYDVALVRELMTSLDTDGNGVLDREEWRKGVLSLPPSLLQALTDPVAPPSMEEFADLRRPILVERAPYYHRIRGSATSIDIDERTVVGQSSHGCTITDSTQRAIRLSQLRALIVHMERRCEAEHWINAQNMALRVATATLFDTIAYVVKPATRARMCSYVELVASEPQPPKWFASHWWGALATDFVTSLEQHARDRGLDANRGSYWSSAFAITQWGGTDGRDSSTASSLMRAMEASTDGVVTIVDHDAKCFSRTWVLYESYTAERLRDEREHFKWDVYTAHQHRLEGELIVPQDGRRCTFHAGASKPSTGSEVTPSGFGSKPQKEEAIFVGHARHAVGLSDGLIEGERDALCKLGREAHFPVKSMLRALQVNLPTAKTTVAYDHTRLLNAVAGNTDLDSVPPQSHSSYNRLNGTVNGFFAMACLVRAINDSGRHLLPATVLALNNATNLRSITLPADTLFASANRARYEEVLSSLPRLLESLSARLPRSMRTISKGKLGNLTKLMKLDLSGSLGMERLPDDVCTFNELKTLELAGCENLITVPSKLFDMPALATINLQGCSSLRAITAFGAHASNVSTLDLQGCKALTELPEAMGPRLARLSLLNLDGCMTLDKLPDWLAQLEKAGQAVIRPGHL